MSRSLRLILICISLALIGGGSIWARLGLAAEAPERRMKIVIPVTESIWWLTSWSDNTIQCQIVVDHPDLPTQKEVFNACGEDLFEEWKETPLCTAAAEGNLTSESCSGLYLFLAAKQPQNRTIEIELPIPTIWVTLTGCVPMPPENRCSQIPDLLISAEEPLPNERIATIHVLIEGEEVLCESSECRVPLPVTPLAGIVVEFWADSSFGDSTEVFTAQVRVVDGGVSAITQQNIWFVDVLSSQWRGPTIASCAQVWEAFPPIGGPTGWLATPAGLEDLATDAPYVFLAGQLISQGAVDASGCPSGGLLENGTANTCGLETAREAVNDWQDQFDAAILQVSADTNIPAQLIKNLFAIESQFWPGMLLPQEFGLGQITEAGADTTLLWNRSFFDEFCPLVLEQSACSGGYLRLGAKEQAMVRGALVARTDSRCVDCPLGIDLSQAEFSIEVFAETLLGNCEQTGKIVRNTTGRSPGEVTSYEDLWRFTLVNYNAGPGCLSKAAQTAWQREGLLDWVHLISWLDPVCETAIDYVNQIVGRAPEEIPEVEPVPTAEPTATPPPVPYPAPQPQPYPAPS